MKRLFACAVAAAAWVPAAASAQSITSERWTVEYLEDEDTCWMHQRFDRGGGVTARVEVLLSWDDVPMMTLRHSRWTMAESSTRAELWFGTSAQQAAHATVPAQFHRQDATTHIDLTLSHEILDAIAGTETLIVRVANGPFEQYRLGPTGEAVSLLLDCYDWVYEDF